MCVLADDDWLMLILILLFAELSSFICLFISAFFVRGKAANGLFFSPLLIFCTFFFVAGQVSEGRR